MFIMYYKANRYIFKTIDKYSTAIFITMLMKNDFCKNRIENLLAGKIVI